MWVFARGSSWIHQSLRHLYSLPVICGDLSITGSSVFFTGKSYINPAWCWLDRTFRQFTLSEDYICKYSLLKFGPQCWCGDAGIGMGAGIPSLLWPATQCCIINRPVPGEHLGESIKAIINPPSFSTFLKETFLSSMGQSYMAMSWRMLSSANTVVSNPYTRLRRRIDIYLTPAPVLWLHILIFQDLHHFHLVLCVSLAKALVIYVESSIISW